MQLDADRAEWERYRLGQHLQRMDGLIRDNTNGTFMRSGVRGERMVEVARHQQLMKKLKSHLTRYMQPTTAPPLSSLPAFGADIGPLGYVPPSHEQWMAAHPQYEGSADADPWLRRLAPHRQPDGSVFRAPVGRPLADGEVDEALGGSAYWNTQHPFHSKAKEYLRMFGRKEPGRLRLLIVDRKKSRTLRHVPAIRKAAEALGWVVDVAEFEAIAGGFYQWLERLNTVRAYHVVMAVHGAGLVNLAHMVPGVGVVVELFPECWCWNDPGREMYGGRLARYAGVKAVVVGVPCPANEDAQECMKAGDAGLVEKGVFVNRSDYASEAEVKDTMGQLLHYLSVNLVQLPDYQVAEAKVPLVQMRS